MSKVSQVSVILYTSSHRGDHAADVSLVIPLKPDETVLDLVRRMTRQHGMRPEDDLKLKIMAYETEPPV